MSDDDYTYEQRILGKKIEIITAKCPQCGSVNEYEVDQHETLYPRHVCAHFQGHMKNEPATAIFEITTKIEEE